MVWLQDNWIIAVVGLVVAIIAAAWLLRRKAPADIAPPVEPAKPAKPLEPAKPKIIAAEPARFKPIEPAPQPARAPDPVAKTPPASATEPAKPAPAPKAAAKPKKAAAKPAPKAAPPPAPKPIPAPAPVPAAPVPAASADNLQLLKGVGPKLVAMLNGLGITGFQQIADWTDADIAAIDPQLGTFQGRIARDNWVDQATYLARRDRAGFEAKYGALGGEF